MEPALVGTILFITESPGAMLEKVTRAVLGTVVMSTVLVVKVFAATVGASVNTSTLALAT